MKNSIIFIICAICTTILIIYAPFNYESNNYNYDKNELTTKLKMYNNFSWFKSDTSIALKKNNIIIWQFNFNKKYDKPYFYPLKTVNSEQELVSLRPSDHPWHRGLWFSWKLINNINYWEEDVKTRLSEGRSKIDTVSFKLNADFSAIITIKLSYAPGDKPAILNEDRLIYVSTPNKNGNYYIDWHSDFKAQNHQLIFDRTLPQKFGGPSYGGYAGLSVRAAQTITNCKYIDSKGWRNTKDIIGYGEKAEWMDLSGITDSLKHLWGGIAIFNHPSNINSPSPWYVFNIKRFFFFNSALLFEKPITLEPFKHIILSYRVLIHEDTLSKVTLSKKYKRFLIASSSQSHKSKIP